MPKRVLFLAGGWLGLTLAVLILLLAGLTDDWTKSSLLSALMLGIVGSCLLIAGKEGAKEKTKRLAGIAAGLVVVVGAVLSWISKGA